MVSLRNVDLAVVLITRAGVQKAPYGSVFPHVAGYMRVPIPINPPIDLPTAIFDPIPFQVNVIAKIHVWRRGKRRKFLCPSRASFIDLWNPLQVS